MIQIRSAAVQLVPVLVLCLTVDRGWAADALEYNRDIRPILAEHCFACHGPDSAARKADLRLDRRAAAIESGALSPGTPDESELVQRIFSADPEQRMPPAAVHKELSAADKERLRQWVAEGAEYQPHWSLIPPRRPLLPAVRNQSWIRNAIDNFILSRLEQRGLQPAPAADLRTLARRVSLDLRGLPPSPAEVDELLADPSPNAYENYVDRMLKSERWGEHRGRYWLDAARYADTNGIHFDNFREIWAYRDWVISAFNRNLPFDQFTIEQLAGDLLPNRTLDQQVASGFHRCNITTSEGGAIADEYLVLYTRDRTETTSHVWLGLTANCAVCHDHKFDPLSQREFYELAAFFNNTTQAAMDGNVKDTPPIIVVPRAEDRGRWEALKDELPRARQALEARSQQAQPEYTAWLTTATPEVLAAVIPKSDLYLQASLSEGSGRVGSVNVQGETRQVVLADSVEWQPGLSGRPAVRGQSGICELPDVGDWDRDQPFSCTLWVNLPANDSSGTLCARMNNDQKYRGWDFWMQRRQIGTHIVNSWPENALKVVGTAQVPANEWTHVAVTYDGSSKSAGVKVYYNGQPQATSVESDLLQDTIRTDVPFKIGQRNTANPLSGAALQDLRIFKRALDPAEVETLAKATRFEVLLAKPIADRTDAEKNDAFPWWLGAFDGAYRELTVKRNALEQEQATLQARGTVAHVANERPDEAMAYVLFRGEYDKRRDSVRPDTPDALPAFPESLPRNRLGFARWLLRPDQPLTARVTVNRFWQEVFGTGLVRTVGDFGVTGESPSHPELLDWLAVEFRESGWDVKRYFKLLVMSATYQQAALSTPEKLAQDSENRLLSRGPRFRMDAEMLRDYALAASGLLSSKIGGPSVKPYQPPGVWEAVAMLGSNTRDYVQDSGENLYRRSMYTLWKRSAPPASMEIFNAPSREFCTVRRERTNTPLQALVTLNDPQFVESARRLAEMALQNEGTSDDRVQWIAKRLLARPLRAEELAVVQLSLADLSTYYQSHVENAQALIAVGESKADAALDVAALAAWTMVINELMNLDELLNK